ncbi:hypothetical protein WMY93_031367 [Mugilogobius chulae]|uniref:Uncharacterized protein n=1 Tax=Mugilogobius chulae TaxID=88201 RepID=A0AAW0MDJ6_9GOBI
MSPHACHVSSAFTQATPYEPPRRPCLLGLHAGHVSSASTQATPYEPPRRPCHLGLHAGHVSSASTQATSHQPPRRPRLMSPHAGHVSSAFMQATPYEPPRRPLLMSSNAGHVSSAFMQATSHRPPCRPRLIGLHAGHVSSASTQATSLRQTMPLRPPTQATPPRSRQAFQPQHSASSGSSVLTRLMAAIPIQLRWINTSLAQAPSYTSSGFPSLLHVMRLFTPTRDTLIHVLPTRAIPSIPSRLTSCASHILSTPSHLMLFYIRLSVSRHSIYAILWYSILIVSPHAIPSMPSLVSSYSIFAILSHAFLSMPSRRMLFYSRHFVSRHSINAILSHAISSMYITHIYHPHHSNSHPLTPGSTSYRSRLPYSDSSEVPSHLPPSVYIADATLFPAFQCSLYSSSYFIPASFPTGSSTSALLSLGVCAVNTRTRLVADLNLHPRARPFHAPPSSTLYIYFHQHFIQDYAIVLLLYLIRIRFQAQSSLLASASRMLSPRPVITIIAYLDNLRSSLDGRRFTFLAPLSTSVSGLLLLQSTFTSLPTSIRYPVALTSFLHYYSLRHSIATQLLHFGGLESAGQIAETGPPH